MLSAAILTDMVCSYEKKNKRKNFETLNSGLEVENFFAIEKEYSWPHQPKWKEIS